MADFNMAANMYGLYPNLYNNQIALNDLTDLDLYAPMGSLNNPMMGAINPMMTMNGSIFGGGMMGGYPVTGGYPTMGGSTGSYQDYYKNYEKYQDFMIDNQVHQQQKWRNVDLRLNAPQEGIQKQAAILHEKILQNEQQQIQAAYANFKNSVKAMYGSGSDEQISNRAASLYQQITGVTVTDDIRQHGRGSFTQGFLQTVTLGMADKKTAEENIAELTGQPVGRTEQGKKFAGNIAGGAVFGGAAAIGANWALKTFLKGLKNKPFIATLIGSAVGLAAAIGTSSAKS